MNGLPVQPWLWACVCLGVGACDPGPQLRHCPRAGLMALALRGQQELMWATGLGTCEWSRDLRDRGAASGKRGGAGPEADGAACLAEELVSEEKAASLSCHAVYHLRQLGTAPSCREGAIATSEQWGLQKGGPDRPVTVWLGLPSAHSQDPKKNDQEKPLRGESQTGNPHPNWGGSLPPSLLGTGNQEACTWSLGWPPRLSGPASSSENRTHLSGWLLWADAGEDPVTGARRV